MAEYLLLTGATGLLGRFLLRDLLAAARPVAVIARPGRRESARDRVDAVLEVWQEQLGTALPRPVCLEGDIAAAGCGLDPADHRWCARHVRRVVHSAAVLRFHAATRSQEPWRTNVGGTRNVLDVCRRWGVRDFHYVSTAYVCGLRQGVIREDELDCGQEFRNDYEQSKLEAEQLVREASYIDRPTVYRPVVVGGDSQTGYTSTYHGIYAYLKLMSLLVWNVAPDADGRRHTPVQLRMTGEEKRNVVPADWVSAVICRLMDTPGARGATFHLATQRPLTPRRVIEAGYAYFNSHGVEFVGPDGAPRASCSEMDEDVRQNTALYQPYDATDPVFDTTNLARFVPDLPCPEIDETMLHRFWRYGEQDRWGRRRRRGGPRTAQRKRLRRLVNG